VSRTAARRRWAAWAVPATLLLAATACLGRIPRDRPTETVVLAAGEATDLPLHDKRPHWLMRDLPRWCGAAEARWGGDDGDRAVLTARAVRFRDEVAATRALDRVTPEYLARAFRDRIADGPTPLDFPTPLPGDEAKANEYSVRLPPEFSDLRLTGQYIAVRSGKAIVVSESIGLPPEELVPVLDAMVRTAERAQSGC
jgi:hypothetical protein